MAYLPELHRCCSCGVDLGPENGDGICLECESKVCDGCGYPKEDCHCGGEMYDIRYEFDAGGEPPRVYLVDAQGTAVMEVPEKPILKDESWSRDEEDWSPGPITQRVLGLLNGEGEK